MHYLISITVPDESHLFHKTKKKIFPFVFFEARARKANVLLSKSIVKSSNNRFDEWLRMKHYVRKAVFPIAGLSAYFLPVTKLASKETLCVIDRPLTQYDVEEIETMFIECCDVLGRYFDDGCTIRAKGIVKKPASGKALSNRAMSGRYIFGPAVMKTLKVIVPSAGGKIKLIDAICANIVHVSFHRMRLEWPLVQLQ